MMDINDGRQALVTQLEARRTEYRRKIDDQVNAEICRAVLGDEMEEFMSKGGQLLPLTIPCGAFKGRKPVSVILHGEEIPAATWKQVQLAILQDCDSTPEYHERLMGLRGCVLSKSRSLLAASPDKLNNPLEINNDLYWEGKQDVEFSMRALSDQILKNVGYSYWNVIIRCHDLQLNSPLDRIQAQDGRLIPLLSAPGSFRGRKPMSVILRGRETAAYTWKEVAAAILRDCSSIPEYHNRLMKLRGRLHLRTRSLLEGTPDGMKAPVKISDNLYWECQYETEVLMRNIITHLIKDVGYDCQDIAVKCRDLQQWPTPMERSADAQERGVESGPSFHM